MAGQGDGKGRAVSDFLKALEIILHHEGGYSDHPDDPGGATNYGITHATLARWRGVPAVTRDDVRALGKEEAAAIYKAWYWDAAECGRWPWPVALLVFDGAVNHGVRQSVRFLQRSARVADDGVIGPRTRQAVLAADPVPLASEIAALRMYFYGSLKTFSTFGRGWSRRLMDVHQRAVAP